MLTVYFGLVDTVSVELDVKRSQLNLMLNGLLRLRVSFLIALRACSNGQRLMTVSRCLQAPFSRLIW